MDDLTSAIKTFWNSEYVWVIYVFLVVFGTLLVNFIEVTFYQHLVKRLKKTKSIWDDAFAWALHQPIGVLIWLYGLIYAAIVAQVPFVEWLIKLRQVGIVFLLAWFFIRFSRKVEENYIQNIPEDAKIDMGMAHTMAHLFKLAIIITTLLLTLQILHINVGPILAIGGAGTIVVGIAAKDLLANFFGSFVIHMDRPFIVGDLIRSPDRNIEGYVEYIGWRLTRIRTLERSPLYVPNSVFTTISVENSTRMKNRRINEVVGIRYRDLNQVEAITQEIKAMIMNHPDMQNDLPCYVNLNRFGSSSLDIVVYGFTKTSKLLPYQEAKQDVMLKIIKIVEKHGAEMAFPTTTLEIPEGILIHSKEHEVR